MVNSFIDPALDYTRYLLDRQMSHARFRDEYMGQVAPGLMSGFNCVEAFEAAPHGMNMGDVAHDPRKVPIEFIESWIFGPRREFTGFAIVRVMKEVLARMTEPKRLHYAPYSQEQRERTFSVPGLPEARFLATWFKDRRSGLPYQSPFDADEYVPFVQFMDYESYYLWGKAASETGKRR